MYLNVLIFGDSLDDNVVWSFLFFDNWVGIRINHIFLIRFRMNWIQIPHDFISFLFFFLFPNYSGSKTLMN